jgi:hypothetical protein
MFRLPLTKPRPTRLTKLGSMIRANDDAERSDEEEWRK